MITVKKFVVNPLQENSFLLFDETGEGLIIDAGFYSQEEEERILLFLESNLLRLVRLINTHCHFDHIMGIEFLRGSFRIPFECHSEESHWLDKAKVTSEFFGISMENVQAADRFIQEGEVIRFGNSTLQVLHVPGHSPGHVAFYSAESNFLIGGDLLFAGSIGRTDLPGGNYRQLIGSIMEKLMVLPLETVVYPGHGPETTLGIEKIHNPFLNDFL